MSDKIKFNNFDEAVNAYFGLLDSYNNIRTHLLSECKNHKETQDALTAANARIAELELNLKSEREKIFILGHQLANVTAKLEKVKKSLSVYANCQLGVLKFINGSEINIEEDNGELARQVLAEIEAEK